MHTGSKLRSDSGTGPAASTDHVQADVKNGKKGRWSEGKNPTSSSGNNGTSSATVFQCSGFGDCHMIFTRSEHLARHVR